MRRADRLLALLEALRSSRLVTGRELAHGLEISLRTLYRDIAALVRLGVPVRGEAGVGYSLEPGYYLPPLNLTPEEAETAALGLGCMAELGDHSLAAKARSARSKIRAVVSGDALGAIDAGLICVLLATDAPASRHDLFELKRFAERRRVLEIDYSGENGQATRIVRPLSFVFASGWLMIAWCEEVSAVRRFRLDRIDRVSPTGAVFRLERHQFRDAGPEQLASIAEA